MLALDFTGEICRYIWSSLHGIDEDHVLCGVCIYWQSSLTRWKNSVGQMEQQKTLDLSSLNGYNLHSLKFAAYFVEICTITHLHCSVVTDCSVVVRRQCSPSNTYSAGRSYIQNYVGVFCCHFRW